MKILFALGSPGLYPDAAWTRIGFFSYIWSKRGHSVEILGTFSYKTLNKRGAKRVANINILNLVMDAGSKHLIFFVLSTFISFIVSMFVLLTRKPDIAIISMPSGAIGIGALMACRLTKTKYIIDYRDEWEDCLINQAKNSLAKNFYRSIKKLTNVLYSKADLIVAVTPVFVKVLEKRGLKNVKLITNGADAKTFKPLNIKKTGKNFIIFYSGGVGGYYRLDIVVKVIKKFVDKGLNSIKLVIAGRGEIQKILNLANELGISSNVKYVGIINEKERLAKLIAMSNVGIVPYDDNPLWKNSVPAKFYEYCACGIPVIAMAYEDSLLAEIIRTHKIGAVSPPLDEEKLVDAILRLYQDKTFREAAGKRARKLIEEKFDRNKIAEEYLSLIKEVIDHKWKYLQKVSQ